MRHRKSGRKLKRTASHRKATLIALCTALLKSKKIRTTVAKAKETRMVVEKLITRAKKALTAAGNAQNIHARRQVARYIKDRAVVKELFNEIAPKVAQRPGGYTRVVKLGQRAGDGAEVALIELVDYNTGQEAAKPKAAKAKKDAAKEKEAAAKKKAAAAKKKEASSADPKY
jgi:large subunit ribosomal protein L17